MNRYQTASPWGTPGRIRFDTAAIRAANPAPDFLRGRGFDLKPSGSHWTAEEFRALARQRHLDEAARRRADDLGALWFGSHRGCRARILTDEARDAVGPLVVSAFELRGRQTRDGRPTTDLHDAIHCPEPGRLAGMLDF